MGNRIGRDTVSSQHLVLLSDGYYSSAKRIPYRGEINHKIDLKVKKDYQVIISPLLQSMLGFRQAILRRGRVCFRLGSGPQERIKFSVHVLSLGGTESGGRCPSTVIENRTGGRKRRRIDHQSV